MNKYQLSEALGNVSDDLLLEAVQIQKRRSPWLRVASLAAVVAILLTWLLWPAEEETFITSPGVLKVYAYTPDEEGGTEFESVVLEEGVKITPNFRYNYQMNYREDFPISFFVDKSLYPDMEIMLEVTTNAGIFYKNEPFDPSVMGTSYVENVLATHYGQHFAVGIDKTIYWEPWGFDYEYMQEQFNQGNREIEKIMKPFLFSQNPSFFDVIIWADDVIIGYCVIEIQEINGVIGQFAQNFSFEVLTIVSFPQVDGQWQDVTYKYVQEKINAIHSEREGLL